jgi:hypothetical protein
MLAKKKLKDKNKIKNVGNFFPLYILENLCIFGSEKGGLGAALLD